MLFRCLKTLRLSIFATIFTISIWSPMGAAIVNGVPVQAEKRPEVFMIFSTASHIEDITTANLSKMTHHNPCTAVAISDSMALTAGHCLMLPNDYPLTKVFALQFGKNNSMRMIKAISSKTNYKRSSYKPMKHRQPGPVPGCAGEMLPLNSTPEADIATLVFPKNTFKSWFEVNRDHEVRIGEPVTFYGYGVHDNSKIIPNLFPMPHAGDLRVGQNVVQRTNQQRIAFWNDENKVFADIGDSGGPVLYQGKVVALIATKEEKCETEFGEDYAILNTAIRLQGLRLKR